MKKLLILTLFLWVTTSVHAQVYKCMGADGKNQFSDTPCKATEKTEVVPDRTGSVSEEDQQAARQRTLRMQEEIAAREKTDEARITEREAEQTREAEQKAQNIDEAKNTEAVSDCVRDIERRGAPQDIKAEMIAACRSAGASQRANSVSADAVRECVRDIERTSASEQEKVRQVALCHGASVEPRQRPTRRRSY